MKRLRLLILLFVGISFNVYALESTPQSIEFQPEKRGGIINFDFDGLILKKEDAIDISSESNDPLIAFLYNLISTNKAGDKKQIISLWQMEEQSRVEAMINQPEMLSRNTSLFKNIKHSKLLGYIEYGDYIVCFIEHDLQGVGEYRKIYPLTRERGQYVQTNGLSSDFLFSQVFYGLGEYLWSN